MFSLNIGIIFINIIIMIFSRFFNIIREDIFGVKGLRGLGLEGVKNVEIFLKNLGKRGWTGGFVITGDSFHQRPSTLKTAGAGSNIAAGLKVLSLSSTL